MSKVSVHNEWDPVEEIIVGTSLFAKLPTNDLGFHALEKLAAESSKSPIQLGNFPQYIIDETEEDLANFVKILEKLNIIVRRPTAIDFPGNFKTLDWESQHYFCYCPRDLLLAIGQSIIETPNVCRSRYFEAYCYKEIMVDYLKSGSKWFSAPKPRLLTEGYDLSNSGGSIILKELEPVFDAANVIKAGIDIFYLISDSGNQLGAEWLQTILGETYRVHPCYNLYSGVHIDSTLSFLRPGLVLVNPSRVNKNNLPELLKKWEVIEAPEMIEKQYSDLHPISTK